MIVDGETRVALGQVYVNRGSVFLTAATKVPHDVLVDAYRGRDVAPDIADTLARWCREHVERIPMDATAGAHRY